MKQKSILIIAGVSIVVVIIVTVVLVLTLSGSNKVENKEVVKTEAETAKGEADAEAEQKAAEEAAAEKFVDLAVQVYLDHLKQKKTEQRVGLQGGWILDDKYVNNMARSDFNEENLKKKIKPKLRQIYDSTISGTNSVKDPGNWQKDDLKNLIVGKEKINNDAKYKFIKKFRMEHDLLDVKDIYPEEWVQNDGIQNLQFLKHIYPEEWVQNDGIKNLQFQRYFDFSASCPSYVNPRDIRDIEILLSSPGTCDEFLSEGSTDCGLLMSEGRNCRGCKNECGQA